MPLAAANYDFSANRRSPLPQHGYQLEDHNHHDDGHRYLHWQVDAGRKMR
jgi:hypothetical protein